MINDGVFQVSQLMGIILHQGELLEWLKIKTICPHCQRKLTAKELRLHPERQLLIEEERIIELFQEVQISSEEQRWRHAALDGWNIIELVLNAVYKEHFKENKPKSLAFHEVIQKLEPFLPNSSVTTKALNKARRARNKIHEGSPDPTPRDAKQILSCASQLCTLYNIPVDKLLKM